MEPHQYIKSLRHQMVLSQTEFARALKVSTTSVSQYERGVTSPSFATLRKIIKLAKENDIPVEFAKFGID